MVEPVTVSTSRHWDSTMRWGMTVTACSPMTRLSLWLSTRTSAMAPSAITVSTSMGPCMLEPCVI